MSGYQGIDIRGTRTYPGYKEISGVQGDRYPGYKRIDIRGTRGYISGVQGDIRGTRG